MIGDAAWAERCARAKLIAPRWQDVRRSWWRVSGYYVTLDSSGLVAVPTRCSCPDYVNRWATCGSKSERAVCKHIVAVRIAVGLQ